MKTFSVIRFSTMWSIKSLTRRVEKLLSEKDQEGYEIVTVSFGINLWMMPTAYITVCK